MVSESMVVKVVLVRHGESEWNKENRFTGWTDVDLTKKGREEAKKAGLLLTKNGFSFDVLHASRLLRSANTLTIIRDTMHSQAPVYHTWRLNERHYGALQGMQKKEAASLYGQEQVDLWRRSWNVSPPAVSYRDPRWPGNDAHYIDLRHDELPLAESLEECTARTLPYWYDVIVPQLAVGKHPLVVASGNSLRAVVKMLDKVSDEDIKDVNIPTGIPLVYELDEKNSFLPIKKYYLGDKEELRKKEEAVKNQSRA